ncbi:MAG: hypothetical protein ACLUKN_17355 [Bacilli bacterium]
MVQQADSFDFLINSKSRDEDYAALRKIYLTQKFDFPKLCNMPQMFFNARFQ